MGGRLLLIYSSLISSVKNVGPKRAKSCFYFIHHQSALYEFYKTFMKEWYSVYLVNYIKHLQVVVFIN